MFLTLVVGAAHVAWRAAGGRDGGATDGSAHRATDSVASGAGALPGGAARAIAAGLTRSAARLVAAGPVRRAACAVAAGLVPGAAGAVTARLHFCTTRRAAALLAFGAGVGARAARIGPGIALAAARLLVVAAGGGRPQAAGRPAPAQARQSGATHCLPHQPKGFSSRDGAGYNPR